MVKEGPPVRTPPALTSDRDALNRTTRPATSWRGLIAPRLSGVQCLMVRMWRTAPDITGRKARQKCDAVRPGDVSRLVCFSEVPFFVMAKTAAICDFVELLR
jgi:hypothetical protein